MFRWFETRVDPFQNYDDSKPLPRSLGAFFKTMLWPIRWVIAIALLFAGLAALAEVLVFHYVQRLIDMMGEATPETMWETYGSELLFMGFVAFLLRPLVDLIEIGRAHV